MTTLSIIIPTLNAGSGFAKLLEALRQQRCEHPAEIVVIDSSSTDGTPAIAQQAGATTITIPRASFNHGDTRNQAIEQSSGDILILLSQDAFPANPQLLANLARNLDDPKVAGVYARHQPYPHHHPLFRQQVLAHSASLVRTESTLTPAEYESLTPLERLQACKFDNVCSAIRRSVWQKIPFPRTTFAEDLAWSKRVLLSGGGVHKIVYDPTALVTHSHEFTVLQSYQRTYQTHRALKELFSLEIIPRGRLIPRMFRQLCRAQSQGLKGVSRSLPQSVADFFQVPAHSLATVLATYRGAASV